MGPPITFTVATWFSEVSMSNVLREGGSRSSSLEASMIRSSISSPLLSLHSLAEHSTVLSRLPDLKNLLALISLSCVWPFLVEESLQPQGRSPSRDSEVSVVLSASDSESAMRPANRVCSGGKLKQRKNHCQTDLEYD